MQNYYEGKERVKQNVAFYKTQELSESHYTEGSGRNFCNGRVV